MEHVISKVGIKFPKKNRGVIMKQIRVSESANDVILNVSKSLGISKKSTVDLVFENLTKEMLVKILISAGEKSTFDDVKFEEDDDPYTVSENDVIYEEEEEIPANGDKTIPDYDEVEFEEDEDEDDEEYDE